MRAMLDYFGGNPPEYEGSWSGGHINQKLSTSSGHVLKVTPNLLCFGFCYLFLELLQEEDCEGKSPRTLMVRPKGGARWSEGGKSCLGKYLKSYQAMRPNP